MATGPAVSTSIIGNVAPSRTLPVLMKYSTRNALSIHAGKREHDNRGYIQENKSRYEFFEFHSHRGSRGAELDQPAHELIKIQMCVFREVIGELAERTPPEPAWVDGKRLENIAAAGLE